MDQPESGDARHVSFQRDLYDAAPSEEMTTAARTITEQRALVLGRARTHLAQETDEPSAMDEMNRHFDFLVTAIGAGIPEVFTNQVLWSMKAPSGKTDRRPQIVEAQMFALEAGLAALGDAVILRAAQGLVETGVALARAPENWQQAGWDEETSEDAIELGRRLVAGDANKATDVVIRALDAGQAPVDVGELLLAPAMRWIGGEWYAGRISVADEHRASRLLYDLLAVLNQAIETAHGQDAPPALVVACAEGNRHGFGADLVAAAFRAAGWTVENLGADVPIEDLVAHAGRLRPRFVGISLSLPRDVVMAQEVIRRIRADLGDDAPRFIVGGAILRRYPELAAVTDAELFARDTEEAVRVATQAA